MSTSGGVRSMRRRSSGGVSPVRTATLGAGSSKPAAAARRANAGERCAQVALDVVVERLERRDVEHAQALAGLGHEAVEEPQEGGRASCRSRSARTAARARPRRSAASPASARASACRARPRTSAARATRTRRARQRWRWTSPPHHTTYDRASPLRQRSSRSNESSALAVTTIAAASVMRGRDEAVARVRALARAEQRADGAAGQRDGGERSSDGSG